MQFFFFHDVLLIIDQPLICLCGWEGGTAGESDRGLTDHTGYSEVIRSDTIQPFKFLAAFPWYAPFLVSH